MVTPMAASLMASVSKLVRVEESISYTH
jgi:hypothetical protein